LNKAGKDIKGHKKAKYALLILCCLLMPSTALAVKDYDGIWFLGFNLKHQLFKSLKVRQAVAHAVNHQVIVNIASEEVIPGSIIPPGMAGYDPELKPYKYNPKYAKQLIGQAGYDLSSPKLKNLVLLHTDGLKTVAIAKQLQKDLKKIGLKLALEQVSYADEEKWAVALAAGKYDFFLMGYKADVEQLFSDSAPSREVDTVDLLGPLFKPIGAANFTGYLNTRLSDLLDQASGLDVTLKNERTAKYREANRLLYKELPVVVLFYIEKL
jgi:ABC-type transport system substrate-binding protein